MKKTSLCLRRTFTLRLLYILAFLTGFGVIVYVVHYSPNVQAELKYQRVKNNVDKTNLVVQEPKPLQFSIPEHDISKTSAKGTPFTTSNLNIGNGNVNFAKLGHTILGYNEHEFSTIPINIQMASYGEAHGGGSCSKDFGNELVNHWRNQKKSICENSNEPQRSSHNEDTWIDCYHTYQTRHHGNGDNLCVYHNVHVDIYQFENDELTQGVVKHYVDTRHFQQPYIKFPNGFISGNCEAATVDPSTWNPNVMPGWNLDWTTQAYKPIPSNDHLTCDVWINHHVLVIQRDTFANFFHDSEDFVNAFLAYAILGWNLQDTQIYLTDLYPEGPFWGVWNESFSYHDPISFSTKLSSHDSVHVMTAWDLKQLFSSPHYQNKNICFKELAVGIYGPAAPITVASWDTPCSHTALVRAYADFIIRGLNLQDHTHYAQSQPNATIVITYMSRKVSSQWPEEKYCDSTGSFFLCKYWANFGPRSLGRMVRNDDDLIKELKELETEIQMIRDIPVQVRVRAVDYNVMTFQEQILIDITTDIMIGPHGAGLMHSIFIKDRGKLIELYVDGSGVNRHFHNLALWAGKKYEGVEAGNPVNVKELKRVVQRSIMDIRPDQY